MLAYTSPAGEEGFPGEVRASVRVTLPADDILEIGWVAETDAATAVNLTHHLYFNLSGAPDRTPILDHALTIAAAAIDAGARRPDPDRRDRAGRWHPVRLPRGRAASARRLTARRPAA